MAVEARAASGIVLAGGQSRRMGRDKALLSHGGETMLARVLGMVGGVVDDMVVVGRQSETEHLGARWVEDEVPGLGPLGGLITGLRLARHPSVLVVACDMPFIRSDVLRCILRYLPSFDAAVPVVDKRPQPLLAAYSATILPTLERRLAQGQLGVQSMLEDIRTRWIGPHELAGVDATWQSFVNVNTPADWRAVTRAMDPPVVSPTRQRGDNHA